MSSKTVYVPRFGSQMERTDLSPCNVAQAQTAKRGNKQARGEKTRFVLKVKLPSLNNHSKKAKQGERTPRRWMSDNTLNKSKTAASRGGETQCNVAVNIS
ncbi:hypothetical protein PAMP_023490 [Pampus punctatissimus]